MFKQIILALIPILLSVGMHIVIIKFNAKRSITSLMVVVFILISLCICLGFALTNAVYLIYVISGIHWLGKLIDSRKR